MSDVIEATVSARFNHLLNERMPLPETLPAKLAEDPSSPSFELARPADFE